MGKKISVFREHDVEYLKDYLVEAVREVLLEQEDVAEQDSGLPEFPAIGGGSAGEFAEGYVCYGIRLGKPDKNRFGTEDGYISIDDMAKADKFGAISGGGMKGWKAEKYYNCVKIGQALAASENGGAPDPNASQSGDETFTQLDGKKGTSKTDVVIFGHNTSMKETAGQLEALESGRSKDALNRIFQDLKKEGSPVAENIQKAMINIIYDQLEAFRTGEQKVDDEGKSMLNAVLSGESVKDNKQALQLVGDVMGLVDPEEITKLTEGLNNTFRSPQFKKRLVHHLATGDYIFPEGSPALATHMLVINASKGQYYFDEITKWTEHAVLDFNIDFRMGRRAFAPVDSKKAYNNLMSNAVQKPTTKLETWKKGMDQMWNDPKKGILARFIRPMASAFDGETEQTILEKIKKTDGYSFEVEVEGSVGGGKTETITVPGVNQYMYEKLKAIVAVLEKKGASSESFDEWWAQMTEWFDAKGGSIKGDDQKVKGWHGRSGAGRGETGKTDYTHDLKGELNEVDVLGWLKKSWKKVVSGVKALGNMIGSLFSSKGIMPVLEDAGVEVESEIKLGAGNPPMESV